MEFSEENVIINPRTREEKLAEFLLMSLSKNAESDCPLREILKQSFMERVLWLEDQSKAQLDHIIKHCEMCKKCHPWDISSENSSEK